MDSEWWRTFFESKFSISGMKQKLNMFFSARSSSNSFHWAPRKPLTDLHKESGTDSRSLLISIECMLADHARD